VKNETGTEKYFKTKITLWCRWYCKSVAH